MAFNPLHIYQILITDSDTRISSVLKDSMMGMGFSNVTLAKSGPDALKLLKQKPFDFMITEWDLEQFNGLELTKRIRRGREINDPSLPIIMMTGRAEETDVVTARNHGVNEYVLKPFSAKSVFSRLERLLENPRNFVVSANFVGPDRRVKGTPPPGISERRASRITVQSRPKKLVTELGGANAVQIWTADMALKKKLGNVDLASLITPEALEAAQATIQAIAGESLLWIQEDLNELNKLFKTMEDGEAYTLLPMNMSDLALQISSRAGTFGYGNASKVSYMLHKFCMSSLRTDNEQHRMVAKHHLNALKVALSKGLKQEESQDENDAVVHGLQLLIDKYGH